MTSPPPRKRLRAAEHKLSPAASSSLEGKARANDEVRVPTQSQDIVDDMNWCHGPTREGGCNKVEEPTVHNEEFYIDSADCVIRVEDTLFKVHQYLLNRDSSAFQNMFSLPAEVGISSLNTEGCSDEHPVRLYGESVERFRILLSVIYGILSQFQIYYTQDADIVRLMTIAEIMNKYHFTSTETWAVNALHSIVRGTYGSPQTEYDLGHCSSALMKWLLEVALLCGHTALRDYVVQRWVNRLIARDLRPIHALEIADDNRIQRLQGYAYYVQLLEMDDRFEPGMMEDGKEYSRSNTALAVAGPDGNGNGGNGISLASSGVGTPVTLTPNQKERLFFGLWSLSLLWERLRSNPPKFQQPEGCTKHQDVCLETWANVWWALCTLEETLRCPAWDVLGRLQAMRRHMSWNVEMHKQLSLALTPQCKSVAFKMLEVTIKEVQEGLVDHFMPQTHTVQGTTANSVEGAL